ncbi:MULTISPECIES: AraC family transcriptional regulator [unclassified Chelatococcus]|uniref:helix-turn-helix transcriptional regulator n=1 Tax=unclassified Chelatococcus TaxID=2638111 RepID=UPI001BD1111A|nr:MULTISPECIES: AraC family transcriptional regulator [unclassified Chelatococcus]CAH1657873.1 AraC family transcriptional regulator [Hyphomicrobiales bacterium]MBS7742248.1 helix-turn-helix transcriptional regulator [Chelatococcus sp. HY11]MBX3542634.1 helix-turn-helix transcriptional regulator [Chelatococcus sp.]MCO5075150.1 AraC family transcriptional regulator [Chelatococcus sp.]CAH1689414.1 AraC family transcriptional regulator [Hyphomicrobiales bacterium]
MDDCEDAAHKKGLFRAYFGGPEGTVSATFRNLAKSDVKLQVDERLGLFHACFDLPAKEGRGAWRFLSPSEGIFAVLTDCEYFTIRHERVAAEGLLEFHFLLEGPVELSLPQERDATAPTNVSLIVCQQAAGMAYDVVCQPGTYKMASFYVRPDLLAGSFGMDVSHSMAQQLLSPREGTMAMSEQKIDPEFLRLLRDLFEIKFTGPRGLPLAAARIIELLVLSVDAVDRGGKAEEQSIVFTARELAMFDRARDVLASDFSESQTIPRLARKLGTNATKLKSGFRLLYGTTIFAYRNRHRMHRAMQLLAESDTPIATVAQAVGFRHQASFTSAFRAHFGLTPKQARQRLVPTDMP